MTRDEAVAMIQRGLAFRTTLASECVLELKEAQRRLETGHFLPYWLLNESVSISATAATATTNLPTDFLREYEQEPLHYIDSENKPVFLRKVDFMDGKDAFNDVENGKPVAYSIRRSSIRWWPIPDITYSLTWTYYAKDETLDTGSTENDWLLKVPNLLIGIAGMKLAKDTRDQAAYSRFQAMQQDGFREMLGEDLDREQTNRFYAMGSAL